MFDDLHDPHPPRPDAAVLTRVIARAERRRRRRRAATAGLAAVVVLAGGAALAATSGIAPGATITDRPIDPDRPGDGSDDSVPTNEEDSGTSLPPTSPAPTDVDNTRTWVPHTSPVPADAEPADRIPYLAIGDSVMLGAAVDLRVRGISVDAQVDRHLGDYVPIVRELRDRDLLGAAVIVHLGTNGPISSRELDELMDLLDDVPLVIVLTVHADRPWTEPNNQRLRSLSERHNVIVIDWAALAPACPGDCFADDGIHLRLDGQQFYATAIGDILGLSPGAAKTPSGGSESTENAADIAAFCAAAPDPAAQVSASYVGSAEHVDDLRDLRARAPVELGEDLDLVIAHFDSAVDPSVPDSQLNENFPDEVNAAIGRVTTLIAQNCFE